ncbi:methyltransferase [Hydrogenophaga laconesensis]|uniref:RNA methylase n=1 Tax=Hydrogenophaga laconesensis TaxID=1805971 RepID=A0ABU1V9L3_9BURK|nr:methyltransferase [Hydrogenophaga laconesensis]MDR7094135.1 putative RNA methylase [Hydrogenophaga laconesensis]
MRIEQDVMAVLSAANVNGNAVVLTGQLDRKLYERTNKVLEAAGGKWTRSAKAHIFPVDAQERIDQIILTGGIEIPKDEFEFFPTPPAVVSLILERAQIEAGMRVLEPSAGQGAIAYPCAELGAHVHCYELMKANYDRLAAESAFLSVGNVDFLNQFPTGDFHRVVMNPPFSRQADIKHVLHALKFLRPDGRLVSVMANGVEFRQDRRAVEFRELVAERGGEIEALPPGSFKASGTGVNTVLVTIPA